MGWLTLVEWVRVGVLGTVADDEAAGDLVVFLGLVERAAIGVGVQRPADGVDD